MTPKRQTIDCDVVVLGTGAAGMTAALSSAEAGADVRCISKLPADAPSCTTRAFGDITWSDDDTRDELVAQIVETGGFLNDQRRVARFADRVPSMLDGLRTLGVELDDPTPSGEGMPGTIRWSYRGKDSGQEMLDLIGERAHRLGAEFVYQHVATALLTDGQGSVGGVAAIDLTGRRPVIFRAPAVIVATGGGACLYPRTDNPGGSTGDGIVMAYEAGAELVDLELIAFGYPPARVGDVLERGEEQREELLGLGHAHYFLGGVRVDVDRRSEEIDGLFAVGEATGGSFGAARLGGSALGDCLQAGRDVGHHAARCAPPDAAGLDDAIDAACGRIERTLQGESDPEAVCERIRQIAWRGIGPVKTDASITRALKELEEIEPELDGLGGARREHVRAAVEARFMHTLARLVATASLERTETRGNYWRADFPEPDDGQLRNIILRKAGDGCQVTAEPLVLTELTEPRPPRIGAGCFGYIDRG